MQPKSWKEAFLASPGPHSRKDYITLYLKAFCMGVADLIPGVSGERLLLLLEFMKEC